MADIQKNALWQNKPILKMSSINKKKQDERKDGAGLVESFIRLGASTST